MVFINNVLVFVILLKIYSSSEISSLGLACTSCQRRNFNQSVAECECRNEQFCDETTGNCSDCGDCFNFWNEAVKVENGNAQSGVNILIQRYENITQAVEAVLTIISTRTKKQENRLRELINHSGKINKSILNIVETINHLKEELEDIERNLKTVNLTTDLNEVLMTFRDVGNKMKDLEKELQKINVAIVKKKKLLQVIDKLKEVADVADMLNSSTWRPEDYLSLALATEHNLDLLDPLINKFDGVANVGNGSSKNLKNSIQWIDKDLVDLIDGLYFHKTVFINDTELKRRASDIRSAANATKLKLEDLFKKQENFEEILRQLKMEKSIYQKIQNLQNKLNVISGYIRKLNDLLKRWKELNILNQELNMYQEELKKFKEKIASIKKVESKMNMLLVEELELMSEFEKIQKFKSIDELRNETMAAIRENEEIACQIISHCGSAQNVTC